MYIRRDKREVILVEDSLVQQKLYERAIKKHGYTNVNLFDNVEEAIENLPGRINPIIVADTDLSGLRKGYEICQVAREMYGVKIPIVGMSAVGSTYTFDYKRVAALWQEAGANLFLSKPVSQLGPHLDQVIEKILMSEEKEKN